MQTTQVFKDKNLVAEGLVSQPCFAFLWQRHISPLTGGVTLCARRSTGSSASSVLSVSAVRARQHHTSLCGVKPTTASLGFQDKGVKGVGPQMHDSAP